MERYHNLQEDTAFGHYTDPFGDRREAEPKRPERPLPCAAMDYKRSFETDCLYFAWLGHSSVFLHMHGLNMMIDPIFSKYASPVQFAGPKRFAGNRMCAKDFPKLDVILLTHNHYDHLDKSTLKQLDGQTEYYIVPKRVGRILASFGIRKDKITELGWYEETMVKGLKVTLVPSQHFSSRTLLDQNSTLWGGYVLQDQGFMVYDTGDGGFADHFQEIRKRYGKPDLAIVECGQYNVRWHASHMFPEESVKACEILEPALAVPVHWGAYVLSDHAFDEPPVRFARRAEEVKVNYQIPMLHAWIERKKEQC